MAQKPISGSEQNNSSKAPKKAEPTQKSVPTSDHPVENVTYKVGPMPPMPPLPLKPYPYKQPYVFTDGTVGFADGYIEAMRLDVFERVGIARKVPFGISFETNDQKLWLLGRKTFAPHFTHDVNKILQAKIDVDDFLNAEARKPCILMRPDKLPQQKFLFSHPKPRDKPHPLAEYKKKRGHKMSESKPNTNQRHAGTLLYRIAPYMESLVFAPPDVAEYISAIHHALEAATWGEFKARIPPKEYKQLLKRLKDPDYDNSERRKLPSDDDPFHPEVWFPEWCDGDYPDWLQARQAEWLPKSILKHFASHETSVLNGDFWMIKPGFEKDIIKALTREGFSLTRRDDLTFW